MDNLLDYQSRDRKIDSPLLRSFALKTEVLSLYDLVVGGTLNQSSLIHSLTTLNSFIQLKNNPKHSGLGLHRTVLDFLRLFWKEGKNIFY